jgi:hypothetical protein
MFNLTNSIEQSRFCEVKASEIETTWTCATQKQSSSISEIFCLTTLCNTVMTSADYLQRIGI